MVKEGYINHERVENDCANLSKYKITGAENYISFFIEAQVHYDII